MWKLLLAAFIASAVRAQELDICLLTADVVCETPGRLSDLLPENEEQMKTFCTVAIKLMDCVHNHDEVCKGQKAYPEFIPGEYERIRETVTDVCDKNSTLYKSLVPNLKCIKTSVQNFRRTCAEFRSRIFSGFWQHANSESGSGDEDSYTRRKNREQEDCLYVLVPPACVAADSGRRCEDKLAKEGVIEFSHRIMGMTDRCSEETLSYLNSLMQIMELEEEEKSMMIEAIAKANVS